MAREEWGDRGKPWPVEGLGRIVIHSEGAGIGQPPRETPLHNGVVDSLRAKVLAGGSPRYVSVPGVDSAGAREVYKIRRPLLDLGGNRGKNVVFVPALGGHGSSSRAYSATKDWITPVAAKKPR